MENSAVCTCPCVSFRAGMRLYMLVEENARRKDFVVGPQRLPLIASFGSAGIRDRDE